VASSALVLVGALAAFSPLDNAIAQTADSSNTRSNSIHDFSMASQPLGQSIMMVAKVAGLPISVNTSLVEGKTAPALTGSMTASQALQRILVGSGLSAEFEQDLIVIRSGNQPQAATTLAPVLVSAMAENAAARFNPATTVGSKEALTQREIPQTVSVITQDQIQEQNARTVTGALARAPGITLVKQTDNASFINGSTVFSRGWQITDYNLDGIPTTITNLPLSSTAIYDRIEVLHGASGLYTGLGGAGGTINVVRKQPGKEYQFNGSVGSGTNNTYLGDLDVTGPLNEAGTLRGRGVVAWQRTGNDNGTFDKTGTFYGILEGDIAEATTAQLGASYETSTGRPQVGFPIYSTGKMIHPSREDYSYPSWNRYTSDTGTIFGNLQHKFNNGWVGKVAATYIDTNALNNFAYQRSAINPLTNQVTGTWSYQPFSNEQQAYDAYLNGPFQLFGRTHQLTVGTNYRRVRTKSDLNSKLTSGFWPFDDVGPDARPSTSLTDYHVPTNGTQEDYGVYANSRFSLADPLTLIVGGRLGWYNATTTFTGTYNNITLFDRENKYRYNDKVTPFAGLVYDINQTYSAYFSYSTIFQPNSATDQSGNIIKPLEGTQYELGVKGTYLDGKATASVALFRGKQKNRPVQDPSDPTGQFFIASGDARTQGVETMLSGEIFPGLVVSTGYTYLNTKLMDDNAAGTQFWQVAPKHMFKFWGNYKLPGQLHDWSVGAGITAVSNTGIEDGVKAAGYALTDARIAYQVNRNIELAVNVSNIFDRYYISSLGGTSGANYLGNGRTTMLTLRASY